MYLCVIRVRGDLGQYLRNFCLDPKINIFPLILNQLF